MAIDYFDAAQRGRVAATTGSLGYDGSGNQVCLQLWNPTLITDKKPVTAYLSILMAQLGGLINNAAYVRFRYFHTQRPNLIANPEFLFSAEDTGTPAAQSALQLRGQIAAASFVQQRLVRLAGDGASWVWTGDGSLLKLPPGNPSIPAIASGTGYEICFDGIVGGAGGNLIVNYEWIESTE